MVDVKTEGKERETDDLKAKLNEEGKLFNYFIMYMKLQILGFHSRGKVAMLVSHTMQFPFA